MYLVLISNGIIIRNTLIWKLKISLKIKIFVWYLFKEVILTKDNLVKRQFGKEELEWGSNVVFIMRMRLLSTCVF
jgi:hypothetical protein